MEIAHVKVGTTPFKLSQLTSLDAKSVIIVSTQFLCKVPHCFIFIIVVQNDEKLKSSFLVSHNRK